jgi:hypothetical protein
VDWWIYLGAAVGALVLLNILVVVLLATMNRPHSDSDEGLGQVRSRDSSG